MKKKIFNNFILLILLVLFIITLAFFIINRYFDKEYHFRENELLTNVLTKTGNNENDLYNNTKKLDFENHFVVIYDKNNNIVSSSKNLPVDIASYKNKSFQSIEEKVTKFDDGKRYVIFTKILDDGNILKVYSLDNYNLSISKNVTKYFLLIIFLLGVLSILTTYYVANKLVEPIIELNEVTDHISSKDISSRVKISDNEELIPIATNFNIMADKVENTILNFFEKQNQLDAILSSMNSGVIAVDNNGKILIFNKFAKKIFNVFGDFIGKNINEVLKDINLELLLSVEKDYKELEIGVLDVVHLRYKTTALVDDTNNQTGKVTVLSDVTDLKKLEKLRTQFVANVSHELKTPLTSIKGFSETLRDVDDEKTKNKFLDIIDDEAERLRRLIDDILSLSAIENQKEINIEKVEAIGLTKDVCGLLEQQARSKNIDFSLITKGNPIFIGDKDKYKQMVINLVDNAIKYTEPSGKVTIRLEETYDDMILTVNDTGNGIANEHLPRLFERFYRVDKSRDRAKGGTGLGLAIVKHIVIGFKGTIDVESEVGKGTKFTIKIPIYRDEENKVISHKLVSNKYS